MRELMFQAYIKEGASNELTLYTHYGFILTDASSRVRLKQ